MDEVLNAGENIMIERLSEGCKCDDSLTFYA